MQHIIINNYREIMKIIDDFFLKKYTRKSIPEFQDNYNKDLFNFACKIYKRGFTSFQNNQYNNFITTTPDFFSKIEFERYISNLSEFKCFFILDENFIKKNILLLNYIEKERYLIFSSTENTKKIETVISLIEQIPDDCKVIVAIGGGIIHDIIGFIAGLLNIKFYYIPSTFLAAIDACIGGKTGVNYSPYGKNQIGLFSQAEKIICVPEYFFTLHFEEILCGLVEAIKHSWIFGEFNNDYTSIINIYNKKYCIDDFLFITKKNILYKSYIVNKDPFELNDIRSALNMGHTFAHILEALAEDSIIHNLPHGIAVAHGLNFVFNLNFLEKPIETKKVINLIFDITNKYPIRIQKIISIEKIKDILIQDKKNENSDHCKLSLPKYSHFSLMDVQKSYLPVLHDFPLEKISNQMFNYIFKTETK